jgi:hypothetical protein
VYIPPNTPTGKWKPLIFSNLDVYSPKVHKLLKFLASRSCEDMPIILAGDFKANMKDNYNVEIVEFLKDTFELDVVTDLSQGTTNLILASIWSLDEMWTINLRFIL